MSDDTILILRLTQGDDVIGQVHKVSKGNYIAIEPLEILYVSEEEAEDENGETVVSNRIMFNQWIPWTMTNNHTFKIHKKNVLTTIAPSEKIIETYHKVIEVLKSTKNHLEKEKTSESEEVNERILN